MALTKKQAYPVYFLLATESALARNLRSSGSTNSAQFLNALQNEVSALDITAVVDPDLADLFVSYDPMAGTQFNQSPKAILGAISALDGDYGDGPCPLGVEQASVWNALSNIP